MFRIPTDNDYGFPFPKLSRFENEPKTVVAWIRGISFLRYSFYSTRVTFYEYVLEKKKRQRTEESIIRNRISETEQRRNYWHFFVQIALRITYGFRCKKPFSNEFRETFTSRYCVLFTLKYVLTNKSSSTVWKQFACKDPLILTCNKNKIEFTAFRNNFSFWLEATKYEY